MFEKDPWINEGGIRLEKHKVVIKAPALTDFFRGGSTTDFKETYDSASVVIMQDMENLTIEHETVKNIGAGE